MADNRNNASIDSENSRVQLSILGKDAARKISQKELRQMGMSHVAYVKPVSYETLKSWTGGTVELDERSNYFALFAADGTPMVVSDDRFAAVVEASERNMELKQLH